MSAEREIRLRITPASAAHCGTGRIDGTSCRHLRDTEDDAWKCGAFSRLIPIGRGMPPRLPECIAAEKSEQAWTEQRPTEQGDYELSILPEKRTSRGSQFPAVIACEVAFWSRPLDEGAPGLRVKYKSGGMWLPLVDNEWLDGALWRKLEIPIDPFLGAPCSSSQQ